MRMSIAWRASMLAGALAVAGGATAQTGADVIKRDLVPASPVNTLLSPRE